MMVIILTAIYLTDDIGVVLEISTEKVMHVFMSG